MTTAFADPPAPLGFSDVGPLPELAASLSGVVAAERRTSWEAMTPDLRLTPDGGIFARGFAPVQMERVGFDALVGQYGVAFPRGPTLMAHMHDVAPDLLSQVWAALLRAAGDDAPAAVKLHQRVGPAGPAIWSASPTSFPASWSVARLVEGLAAELPHLGGVLSYDPERSTIELRIRTAPGIEAVVRAEDQYVGAGTTVEVLVDGVSKGDPLPTLRPRRRASTDVGATTVAGVVEKLRACSSRGAVLGSGS